jgi:1,4-alpha-glucan branching enzyme
MTEHFTFFSSDDLYLFNNGTHCRLYNKLGSHPYQLNGTDGTYFAVWAPNAEQVLVVGDFNGWDKGASQLYSRDLSGIWEGFVPHAKTGDRYKYHIVSRYNGYRVDKADPFAKYSEVPPERASRIWNLEYSWGDG